MRFVFLLIILFYPHQRSWSLEYSKIEFDGCAENSFCKKETGLTRKNWLEQLKNFSSGKLSASKFNSLLQEEYGLPISAWALEAGSLLPNILLWNSPCKQHSKPPAKYFIAEIFRKNLSKKELQENPNIIFSRSIVFNKNQAQYSAIVPRDDAPLFIQAGALCYLRTEEGIFYHLCIDQTGHFLVSKNETTPFASQAIDCTTEQITQFNNLLMKESMSPSFYAGTYCRQIWDKTTNSYKTIILGRSCD